MKHEILEEIWRVRDTISAECGHDVERLAAMLRKQEAKYGDRLALLPIVRRAKPVGLVRETSPRYGKKS